MSEPDYIVIRPALDLPAGFLPEREDGRWYDRNDVPYGPPAGASPGDAVAVPTGRFEVRDSDGAVAEVLEVRP
jgi:hypothetical protein